MSEATGETTVQKVRALVAPLLADLKLDLYDIEFRGGTLRITIDTPPGSTAGVDLDTIALATRLVSRELDHEDPLPGRYTLEVTSPGVERTLRTPAHFRREIGKTVNVRLVDVGHAERRVEGVLVAADDTTATVQVADPETGAPADRTIPYDHIDRARTVFVWGPAPKPGGPKQPRSKQPRPKQPRSKQPRSKQPAERETQPEMEPEMNKEPS